MSTIPCTIGVLTFNSAKDLSRCLESVRDFAEVVVADGGSTDATLEIAKKAGATIITQSNPGHSISDFARERNLLLKAATQQWFFYLDADEAMSPELKEEIKSITYSPDAKQAYRVRYLKTNADLSQKYRTFKEYYQVRLFRTDIGARFERAVHERVVLPEGTSLGQVEGPWFVPLDEGDLRLRNFARKAWARTAITARGWKPKNVRDVVQKILIAPIVDVIKSLIKIVGVRIKWGKEAIPLKYELLRILYTCMQWARSVQQLVRTIWPYTKSK